MKLGGRRSLAPDPDLIRRLAELLSETGLSEIEYSVGDQRLRVARRTDAAAAPTPAAHPGPAPAATLVNSVPTAALPPAEHPGAVKAPMVGVAYLAPQPGAAPFVRSGDAVAEGDTLLIIEAMKVMNQIRAPRAGRLAQILVEDGAPVEYGTALMVIE